ncbi:MAG: hypothetical protein A2137_01465 [Chloroflexi bacterium RBG_16_58_8]|nr:MAG: hypothetical protein A2137_01465 [Chloroflexi bacterium RBG_16_58_8]
MVSRIKSLIAELTCDDVIRCQNARRALVAMGHPAVGPLIKGLSNEKHWVRWEAAKALSQIGDAAAARALTKALEDEEFDVRWLAAEGLIAIGRKGLPYLLAALADHGDKSLWLRQGAHHVLHDIDRGKLDETLRPVMAAVGDAAPAHEVLQAAKKALDVIRKR